MAGKLHCSISVLVECTRTSAHDVAVYVDRIYRVGDTHAVVPAKQFADVSGITFSTVADKYFRRAEADSSWCKVVLDDGLYQKIVTLFGTISVECLGICHFVYRTMHGFDAYGRKRAGYIAYTQSDQFLSGMCNFKCVYFFAMSENK